VVSLGPAQRPQVGQHTEPTTSPRP
jgi:hypothetical protein